MISASAPSSITAATSTNNNHNNIRARLSKQHTRVLRLGPPPYTNLIPGLPNRLGCIAVKLILRDIDSDACRQTQGMSIPGAICPFIWSSTRSNLIRMILSLQTGLELHQPHQTVSQMSRKVEPREAYTYETGAFSNQRSGNKYALVRALLGLFFLFLIFFPFQRPKVTSGLNL